jgi:3-oxoacyl-[acyl-carrier-protein] synthase-1
MSSVKITGLGALCANGMNKESIFESCANGRSAIGENGLATIPERELAKIFEQTPLNLRGSKCTAISHHALKAALNEAQWSEQETLSAGFIFASTTAQVDQWEKVLPFYRTPDFDIARIKTGVANQSLGTPAIHLAEHFGAKGPMALLASSCSASLQAIAMASEWIRTGKVQRCIVGGTEIHSDLTRVGFSSLRLLSSQNCKPFDKNRNGINLGEGSAFLCLEAADLRATSAHTWGFVAGMGLSTDAHHATSPHPEGLGSQKSMTMALHSANLPAEKIDWVYAHGTGSPANDLAESKAIRAVFQNHTPFVNSTKSAHGHTLGACGALESALGLLAMHKQVILPTPNFEQADAEITLPISARAQESHIRYFLKNSLGFGGINASVIFSKEAGRA